MLSPDARLRVFSAWPQLPLRNITNGRAEVLNSLRDNYPPRSTLELLTARERANTTDDRPFAAPRGRPTTTTAGWLKSCLSAGQLHFQTSAAAGNESGQFTG